MRAGLFLSISWLLVSITFQSAEAARIELPLGRNVESALLEKALQVPPEKLIQFVEAQGVKVYIYPSVRPANPVYASGKPLPAEIHRADKLLRDWFEDEGKGSTAPECGQFISPEDKELGQFGPMIVVAADSEPHTLVHEFTHYLFYTTEKTKIPHEKAALTPRAERAYREFGLQFSYSFLNLGSSNVYQRDVLMDRMIEKIQVVNEHARWFVSEEVFIEGILAKMIVPGSPYYKVERMEKSGRYSRRNIREARIDLAREMAMYNEIVHGFTRVAGAQDVTSHAEMEEILTSLPLYTESVMKEFEAGTKIIDIIERFNADPSYAVAN